MCSCPIRLPPFSGHEVKITAVLYDIEIFREGAASGDRTRNDSPIETAPAPAGAVEFQNPGEMIQIAFRIADGAVIHISGDDDFQRAVAIDISDRGCAVGEVGPVFCATVGVAA